MDKFLEALSAVTTASLENTPYVVAAYPSYLDDMAIRRNVIVANIVTGYNAVIVQVVPADSELWQVAIIRTEPTIIDSPYMAEIDIIKNKVNEALNKFIGNKE